MRIPCRFAFVLLAFVFLCAEAWSQQGRERELFDSANRARKAQGLPSLKWDEALATAARKHAEQMASHGSVSHQFAGEPSLPGRATQAGAHFVWLSENVDQGPSASSVHESFMKSPLHRANILDRDMDSVGIGLAARSGQLFVVEDFSKAK
jgi:uncharacterized protein YkwD